MTTEAGDKILRYAAITHRGRVRDGNEDAVFAVGAILRGDEDVRSGTVSFGRQGVFMIADGMGGHARGEIASNHALEYLKTNINRFPSVDWEARILGANDEIFDLMARNLDFTGMGTTLVGAEISAVGTIFFNVGDSRAYRLVGGRLVKTSVDDVPKYAGARTRTHEITQALGGRPSRGRIFPHVSQEAPLEDDEQVLLCSDGLSDMVSEAVIYNILLKETDPSNAVRLLLQAALDAGGTDNISIISARLGPSCNQTNPGDAAGVI
ncbi:serine/threonine-protein phosphatase [Rhizobium laguerreae]|uniref:PP2C family protein-serine/threonine phosphatase n=1 Tax=Rhizobium laguerreae TaxID=1076926 RepID=UPI001C92731C|nr:protein phosphatase 2C domain-containing protein [Rhizobium laguerreae]MBY3158982.1 serine/threonine-protein phosphatase [Rhizobium laguerreae]